MFISVIVVLGFLNITFESECLPISIRNGANSVYFIIRAIGSANKLGIISRQCAGTDAVFVD